MTEGPFRARIDEHEAVRAAVRQLDERYNPHPRPSTGISTPAKPAVLPKDALRNLRWQLFYLLEGVTGHFTRDEAVVFSQVNAATRKVIEAEHEGIRKEVESALALVTRMAEAAGTETDMVRDTAEIGRKMHRLRELIEAHTTREDAIMREAIKAGRTVAAPNGIEYQVH